MDDWIDATAVGSAYQQQFSPSTGQWRHRWCPFPGSNPARYSDWRPGPAPATVKKA